LLGWVENKIYSGGGASEFMHAVQQKQQQGSPGLPLSGAPAPTTPAAVPATNGLLSIPVPATTSNAPAAPAK